MNVSTFLTPHLRELEIELRATLPRLDNRDDKEGVHDFRVVLRRLRSLLRPARRVYGKFHTDAVRAALKGVADASGSLRDEEVLEETLAKLELPAIARSELSKWLTMRKRRLSTLRSALLRLVRSGAVARALALLDALLVLPVDPAHDKPAEHFARKVVHAAKADVHRERHVALDDVLGLHALRILYKRLRYAVDGFAGVLAPELAAIAPSATKFQKRLGDIHDLDVATVVIGRARGLSEAVRVQVRVAIAARRSIVVAKYVSERYAPETQEIEPNSARIVTTKAHQPRRATPRVKTTKRAKDAR